jgi:DNA polymerase
MPIALKYSGAKTHRFSGDWLLNQQNLPRNDRGDRTKPSKLRLALEAPPGKLVVSVDASQIEARLNAAVSKQKDLIDDFAHGRDVYSSFAELVFGYKVAKATHPMERFVGKTSILSLGYGSSWSTFQNMLRNQGGLQFPTPQAMLAVELYRGRYEKIVEQWKLGNGAIEFMHFSGEKEWKKHGPLPSCPTATGSGTTTCTARRTRSRASRSGGTSTAPGA